MANRGNVSFQTPLHTAIIFRRFSMVEYLVEQGVDIDAKDILGRTPLMYAVLTGQIDIVKCLVEHGANVNLKDYTGMTALYHATRRGYCSMAHYLVETGGANIEESDDTGKTPWELARESGLSWLYDYYSTELYKKHNPNMFDFSYGEHDFDSAKTLNLDEIY